MPNYYQLQVVANGTTTSAYYYVNLASGVDYDSAAVTIYPSKTSATYFSYNSSSVQFQAPPATTIGAGITVITDANNILGTFGITPAIAVDAKLNLYGAGGPMGSVTLPAGQTSIPFNFPVNSSQAMNAEGAKAAAASIAPKPAEE